MSTTTPRAEAMNAAATELRYRRGVNLWMGLLRDAANREAFLRTFARQVSADRAEWELWLGRLGETEVAAPTATPARADTLPPARPTGTVVREGKSGAGASDIASWEMCFRLACADGREVALDRIARSDLVFEGSRALYAHLAKEAPAGDALARARVINQSTQEHANRLNASPSLAADWRVIVIPAGDAFDAEKCQYAGGESGAAFDGGPAKIRPVSFAIHDLKSGKVRKRALVEPLE